MDPYEGWFSLNSNGTTMGNLGLVGYYGGLIADCNGTQISGFNKGIEKTQSVTAELWDLLKGLKLIVPLNIIKLNIQMDVASIIDLIIRNSPKNVLLNPFFT